MVKKINSLKTIVVWCLLSVISLIISIIFIKYFPEEYLFKGLFIGITIINFIMIFTAKTTILIDENNKIIKLILTPLLDPSRGRQERIKLDNWNNNVKLEDIENYKFIKVSKDVKKKNLGSQFIFNYYIQFDMKNGNSKYFYISLFSKKQKKIIIDVINKYLS